MFRIICNALIVSLIVICLWSCTPVKMFWVSSEGIVTYNRHTGAFEMMWENSCKPAVADSVQSSRVPN